MSATVILSSTGTNELKDAIESVLEQSYPTELYLIIDGPKYYENSHKIIKKYFDKNEKIKICSLPENVGLRSGPTGFYSHRIYAAFTHLINTEYVLYLDQDCWFENNHVESLVNKIKLDNLDWSYSLRNIYNKENKFICQDNCESLGPSWPIAGYPHVDTNCYCIKTQVATKIAHIWHGGWGQDRVFLNILHNAFKKFDTTGLYTANYRVGGNEGSVKPEFFLNNNKQVEQHYNGVLPWRKI